MKTHRTYILVLFILISGTLFSQKGVSEFEDLEEISKKGFFKNYVSGLFKGFKDLGEPFNLSGGIGLSMRSYSAYGAEARQDPFFYSLNANVNIRVYKLNLPFSLLVSAKNTDSSLPNLGELVRAFRNNVENKIENQKNRFVRFGTSPKYKWIKLHFGHRAMNFSQFTLANLNFLGAGMELNPGKIRIGAMYGRLAKAEPIDLSLVTPNIPVFERVGWGTKLGYGTNEQYIDFIVFKAADDFNSIDIPVDVVQQVPPEENLVIGLNAQKTFLEKFNLKFEYASSALSPNSEDAPTANQFPHPKFLLTGRATTQYKSAFESSLNYQAKIFTVGVKYKRIDPDYKSLGAYFFNNDIEDYTGNVSFGMLQNKVNVNMSAGVQRNNLDETKDSRLTRFIGTGDISYSAGQFNLGVNYSNNSSDVSYLLNEDLDSLNVIIVTQDAGLTTSYSIQDKAKNQHVITGSFNVQGVTDDIADPMQSSASKMLVGNLVYNYSLAASKWKFTLKANYNQNELSQMIMNRYGGGLGITKNFFDGKMNTGLDFNYFLTTSETAGENGTLNAQFRMNSKIGEGMSINMNWGLLSTRKELNNETTTFAELTGTLAIQYSFAMKPKKKKEKEKGEGDKGAEKKGEGAEEDKKGTKKKKEKKSKKNKSSDENQDDANSN